MAKFKQQNLRFKDNQKAQFGDSQDANIWWDGSDFRLDTTISGVNPTQDYHLTTKLYVDDEITTATGSLTTDHGELTGLGDDDHTQYHNDTRGDARYYTQTQLNAGQLDNRYYTEAEVDTWRNSTTQTEMGYVHGVTSDIQIQLNSKSNTGHNHVSTDTTDFDEAAQDAVGNIITGTTFIDVTYNDVSNSITVSGIDHDNTYHIEEYITSDMITYDALYATGSVGTTSGTVATGNHLHDGRYYTEEEVDTISGVLQTNINGKSDTVHTHTSTDTTDFDEASQDAVGNIMVGAGGTSVTYDDAANTITISGATVSGIITDHGALDGLTDDDHTQYYNQTRGDARYPQLDHTHTLLNLTDTPSEYQTGWYLRSTASGAEWSTVSGVGGTSNHSELNELDYASAGHTGFASTTTLVTTSGGLQTQIDNKIEEVSDDSSPALGGDLTLNTHNINYGIALTSNGTYEGDIRTATVDDASSAFGNTLYLASDGHYDRADASASSTLPCRVLVIEAGAGTKKLLVRGEICNTSWNWTPGTTLYVSEAVGSVTDIQPTLSGTYVQAIGYALTADTLFFDPSQPIIRLK